LQRFCDQTEICYLVTTISGREKVHHVIIPITPIYTPIVDCIWMVVDIRVVVDIRL